MCKAHHYLIRESQIGDGVGHNWVTVPSNSLTAARITHQQLEEERRGMLKHHRDLVLASAAGQYQLVSRQYLQRHDAAAARLSPTGPRYIHNSPLIVWVSRRVGDEAGKSLRKEPFAVLLGPSRGSFFPDGPKMDVWRDCRWKRSEYHAQLPPTSLAAGLCWLGSLFNSCVPLDRSSLSPHRPYRIRARCFV